MIKYSISFILEEANIVKITNCSKEKGKGNNPPRNEQDFTRLLPNVELITNAKNNYATGY